MQRVHRTDFAGRVRGIVETPQGGVRVPAAITRVGVLSYEDGNGKRWRELRPASEVFSTDSLATLRDAPVTELHPPELVTRDNWDRYAIGHNGADARVEDDRLVTTDGLVVQSGPSAEKIRRGDLAETSAGYTCDLDETPGTDPVEGPYDKVQRAIRYNHIALGPEGWARGGREMALRMDGAAVHVPDDGTVQRNDGAARAAKGAPMRILKIMGKAFRADDEKELAEAQKTVDGMEADQKKTDAENSSLEAKVEALSNTLLEATKEMMGLKVELAAKKSTEPDGDEAVVTEEQVPEAVQDSIFAKRLALVEGARAVLGADVKLDGLAPAAIRAQVLAKAMPNVRVDSLDKKVLDGMFTAVVETAKAAQTKRADGNAKVADVLTPAERGAPTERGDGKSVNHTDSLQQKLVERGRNPLMKVS